MDPRFSAQDVLCCDLCESPVAQIYCDFCHVKLCKACVGEHLSDSSKKHKVMPIKQRESTLKCQNHYGKHCELYCEKCNHPVCSLCLSSNFHKGHTLLNILEIINSKQKTIQKDVDELSNLTCPNYEVISTEIQREKTDLEKQYQKLKTAVTKQGETWHREIDNIVNKQKSEIEEMKIKHLAVLHKQENEIQQIITEVKQCILDLKKLLDSNDVSVTSAYKSRNAKFKQLPSKINTSPPSFFPQKINTELLHQMFGSLSTLSITTEEHDTTMKTTEAPCSPVKPLLDEPELITTINTGCKSLLSINCLSDEAIWTRGNDKVIKLFNLQGKILQSIRTTSGNVPFDIAVTTGGDLVFTDPGTKSVNIMKNDQIEEMISLQWWIPYNICSTSSGDLLVTMYSPNNKRSKIVRYSGSTEKQTIQFDSKRKPLFSPKDIKYISENRNLDICVADMGSRSVVVVNQAGKLRFRYTGHPSTTRGSFYPYGITTDSQSQILTSELINNCIYILDQDGQFLRYIKNCDLIYPYGLCVDTKDNLFVAEYDSGKVKKIKYM